MVYSQATRGLLISCSWSAHKLLGIASLATDHFLSCHSQVTHLPLIGYALVTHGLLTSYSLTAWSWPPPLRPLVVRTGWEQTSYYLHFTHYSALPIDSISPLAPSLTHSLLTPHPWATLWSLSLSACSSRECYSLLTQVVMLLTTSSSLITYSLLFTHHSLLPIAGQLYSPCILPASSSTHS